MKQKISVNHHTHTRYCDGKAAPEEYVKAALDAGFSGIGFSAHAPLPFANAWSMKEEDAAAYFAEIRKLEKEYAGRIEVFAALEQDYVPGMTKAFAAVKKETSADYLIGAIHLVVAQEQQGLWFIDGPKENFDSGLSNIFQGDIRKALQAYFHQLREMISREKPDVIAHFDKIKMNNAGRYFSEDEPAYLREISDTLDAIAASGGIMEVNTRGLYTGRFADFYPAARFLKQACALKIPVTISSDAHQPAEIASGFAEAEAMLKDAGYKDVKVFTDKGWAECPL
jgi:histidinol-phosphatase (PHP family)